MVTTDFNIPLFHAVYPGNRNDAQEFQSITDELVARRAALQASCDKMTLVYDKGNNSQTNQAAVDASPFHFVGSLKANQAPELLDVPLTEYQTIPEHPGLQAYRTTRQVLGQERTVVVTYNEALYLGQFQGELVRLRKLQDRLQTLQRQAIQGVRRPAVATLRQRVTQAKTKAGPPVRDWVHTEIGEEGDYPTLTYAIDHQALMQWGQIHWGKTILFTDQATWPTADIITAYRDAWHVESTFRDVKQSPWLHWQPQFHWTDQKIHVHGFICVLAVTLAHLLRREYARAGIDLSLPTLLKELTAIQEVLWVYPFRTQMPPQLVLTDRTPRQQQLLDHLAIRLPVPQ